VTPVDVLGPHEYVEIIAAPDEAASALGNQMPNDSSLPSRLHRGSTPVTPAAIARDNCVPSGSVMPPISAVCAAAVVVRTVALFGFVISFAP
jgi:hypothetical protein